MWPATRGNRPTSLNVDFPIQVTTSKRSRINPLIAPGRSYVGVGQKESDDDALGEAARGSRNGKARCFGVTSSPCSPMAGRRGFALLATDQDRVVTVRQLPSANGASARGKIWASPAISSIAATMRRCPAAARIARHRPVLGREDLVQDHDSGSRYAPRARDRGERGSSSRPRRDHS